jgi:hypothetical protein
MLGVTEKKSSNIDFYIRVEIEFDTKQMSYKN